MRERFDVIVVGAGSSGGALAARLSEDPDRQVLLLEAGPDFPDEATLTPAFTVSSAPLDPAGIPELDWGLWSEPLPAGQRVRLPRGRLVGGSSMVNGTVAVRGAPGDFDRWAQKGNTNWSWERLLPYFKKIESDADFGSAPYHGDRGPIHIRRYVDAMLSPIHEAFMEGCGELGMRFAEDLNAPDATVNCVGPWPQNRLNDLRQGTLVTYIRAARARPNLHLRAHATVDRVRISGGRAVGTSYVTQSGEVVEVDAELVVLCAGAYLTPAILQRSGIGPPEVLGRAGITCGVDLPVGANLSDHANVLFAVASQELAPSRGRTFLANCRSPAGPDGASGWQALAVPMDERAGLAAVVVNLTQQEALGTVSVTGADPLDVPSIDHRYLSAEADMQNLDEGWEFCRELIATAPFRAVGARDANEARTGRETARTAVGTALHPVGTCRMGPADDATSVVDQSLNVRGVEGLMVADASVFPDNISFNTNLTCYVVGEVAADIIRNTVSEPPAALAHV